MSRVNFRGWRVKCRGSEITHIFFNKLLRELTTFFRIQPCYSSGNVDGNPGETYRLGSKQPFMGLSSQTISNLKRLIKHSWIVRGSVEKGHLFWKNKTKLQENRSVEPGSSKRISSEKIISLRRRPHICFPRPRCTCKPQPVLSAHAIVGQTSKSTGTRNGRYRPNRSKTFCR